MGRLLLIVGLALSLLLALSIAALYWLGYTESGLHWALGQTSRLKSMELNVVGSSGVLAGPLRAERIELKHERFDLNVSDVEIDVNLHSLLLQTIHIDKLRAAAVGVTLKPRTSPPTGRKPRFLPPWLRVRTDDVSIAGAQLNLSSGRRLRAEMLRGEARISSDRIVLENVLVRDLLQAGEGTAPRLTAQGRVSLRAANPAGLNGELHLNADIAGQPQYAGKISMDGNLAQLQLELDLVQPLAATLQGVLFDLNSKWRWEAHGRAAELNLKPWSPPSQIGDLAVELRGNGNSEGFELTGRIDPRSLSTGPLNIAFAGSYAEKQVRAERMQLELPASGTRINARGGMGFAGGPPRLDLQGEWSKLRWPITKPTVSSERGKFTIAGSLPYTYTVIGDLSAPRLNKAHFNSRGTVGREELLVEELRAQLAGSVKASGRMSFGDRKSWQLAAEVRDFDPSLLLPDQGETIAGNIGFQLHGSGNGLGLDSSWQARLTGLHGKLREQPISGHGQISHTATVWELDKVLLRFGSARLEAAGRFDTRPNQQPDIRWTLSANDLAHLLPQAEGQVEFNGRLSGTHEAPKLVATLKGQRLQYQRYSAASLDAQADVDLTTALSTRVNAQRDLGRVHLAVQGTDIGLLGQTFESLQVSADGNAAAHTLKAEVRAPRRQLLLVLQGGYSPRQWRGEINEMKVALSQTDITLEQPITLFVSDERIDVEAFCLNYPPQKICGELHANGARDGGFGQFALTGSLQAKTRELGFIPALAPEIDRVSGLLSAQLKLSGTLRAPQVEGVLALEEGEMDLYAVNLLAREISARLQMSGKTLRLTAKARAGEGNFAADGQLTWEAGAPYGNLDLKGEKLLVVNVPEARVLASPNISVGINGRNIQVDGAVRIPQARLAPANLTGAMLPSEDEVIVGSAPADPRKSFRVTTGIHLILGKEVTIDSYGLTGRITGSIAAYTAPEEISTASGELKIEDGKYKAYGQELEIDRGRLIFTGGLISNPGVEIRAIRKIEETLVGVNVRGTLRDPRMSFFSEPPMTQTQVASLLITGRTFDSMQEEGGGPGLGREQLIAQGGALLAKQLGVDLGIDDVSVESSSGEQTSLVLGKYLSPRLYVGYGISLAEAINTFKLRYTLGDRWTIKMEAGEVGSADVVYAIDR